VSRLAEAYKNFGTRFLNRIYDDLELEQFNKKSDRAKPFFLAKNFAGKEAVSKVIGYGFTKGVRPKDIVILRKYGGPRVLLNGKAKILASEQGLDEISLSLSDTEEHATAMAVAYVK
jgi:holo-[acyl-carrier protein] synthase